MSELSINCVLNSTWSKMSAKVETSPNLSSSSECDFDDSGVQYMLYYLRGGLPIRPMGLITGPIAEQDKKSAPYHLRRSGGEIQVVPYKPNDKIMKDDYDLVTEANIDSQSAKSVSVVVRGRASVNVFGEVFGGFSFTEGTSLDMSGYLHLAYWIPNEGIAEKSLDCPSLIEVNEGEATFYICDDQHIILMYDENKSKYWINLIKEKVDADEDKPVHASKTIERITESLTRLRQASKDSLAGGEKKPKSSSAPSSRKSPDLSKAVVYDTMKWSDNSKDKSKGKGTPPLSKAKTNGVMIKEVTKSHAKRARPKQNVKLSASKFSMKSSTTLKTLGSQTKKGESVKLKSSTGDSGGKSTSSTNSVTQALLRRKSKNSSKKSSSNSPSSTSPSPKSNHKDNSKKAKSPKKGEKKDDKKKPPEM